MSTISQPLPLPASAHAEWERVTGQRWPADRDAWLSIARRIGYTNAEAEAMTNDAIRLVAIGWYRREAESAVSLDDAMPAAWIDRATRGLLSADTLLKARGAGRIESTRRGGRHFYRVGDVIRLYPDHKAMILSALENG